MAAQEYMYCMCTCTVYVYAHASAVASERVRMCPYMHARLSALGAARRSHAHGAARGTALSAWRSALGATRGSIHFAPRSPHRGKKPRVAPHAYANQTPLRCSQINLPHLTRAQRAKRKKCVMFVSPRSRFSGRVRPPFQIFRVRSENIKVGELVMYVSLNQHQAVCKSYTNIRPGPARALGSTRPT